MDRYAEHLAKRSDNAWAQQRLWQSTLIDAYRYTQPNRNLWDQLLSPGARKNTIVYDTTAVKSAIRLVSKWQSAVTPVGKRWARLVPGPNVSPQARPQWERALENLTEILFNYIHASNFDLAISESYFDFIVGTAAIKVAEGDIDNPLIFTALQTYNLAFEESNTGFIDNIFHKFEKVKGVNIKALWPDATLPLSVRNALANDETAAFDLRESFITDPTTREVRYTVQLIEDNEIIVDRTSPSLPVVAFRWAKLTGEVFGRGPVLEALPTIKTLNKLVEMDLKGSALSIMPPFLSFDEGLVNPWTIKIEPLAIIPVTPLAGGVPPLQQLKVVQQYTAQFAQVNDLRQQIKDIMLDSPLGPTEAPVKTATEIIQRQKVLEEEMTPAFERLQIEFLPRLLNRIVFILRKKGLFPNVIIDGKHIDVHYESPLSLSQGQEDAQKMIQYFGTLSQMLGPQLALMGLKHEQLPQWLARKFGVDMNLVPTPDEIETFMQKQLQQIQQNPQVAAQRQLPTPSPLLGA